MRMDSRFNIFFLSNMMLEKGVWTLLDACHILKDRGYDFVCNFVGKWSDIGEEEFAAYLQKYRLEDVVVAHGAKYGNDKEMYWMQADLLYFLLTMSVSLWFCWKQCNMVWLALLVMKGE